MSSKGHPPIRALAALHSSDLGGAERSHVERALDLRGEGVLLHSLIPAPDSGLGTVLDELGLPFSVMTFTPWWIATSEPDVQDVGSGELASFVSPPSVKEYLDRMKAFRPDVVLSITCVNPHAALAARMLDIPHVWFLSELAVPEHGLFVTVPHTEVGHEIARLSDRVVCVSRAVRDKFFGQLTEAEFEARGIRVIHDAPRLLEAPQDDGSSEQRSAEHREAHGQASEGWHTVGVVGTFVPGKRHALAIEALGTLARRGVRVRMTFFGSGPESGAQSLLRLAQENGVDDRLEFRYERDQRAVFAAVDSIVVPSTDEGFGRVPFEAATEGRPVIYAKSGALKEFMVNGITGIAFEPGDGHGLADAIARLIGDVDLKVSLAASAREHLRKFCESPPRGSAVREILEEALDSRRTTGGSPDPQDILAATFIRMVEGQAAAEDAYSVLAAEHEELAGKQQDLLVQQAVLWADIRGLESEREGLLGERDWWFVQFHHLRQRRSVRAVLWVSSFFGRRS